MYYHPPADSNHHHGGATSVENITRQVLAAHVGFCVPKAAPVGADESELRIFNLRYLKDI
ncbi:hypothetical protein QQP08_014912 [Theobroma cacao]|nr:hypothetical protein QQP08_014912 [Theobroma cacao]